MDSFISIILSILLSNTLILYGLFTKSLAPKAKAFSSVSSASLSVVTITGILLYSGSFLNSSRNPYPSITGITMSNKIAEIRSLSVFKISNASRPFSAPITVYLSSNKALRISLFISWSSTTKTVFFICPPVIIISHL